MTKTNVATNPINDIVSTPHYNMPPRVYELWNSYTHLIGAGLAIVGMILMLNIGIAEKSTGKIFAGLIYGLSMVILYAMSSLYHIASDPKVKTVLRIFDHCSIFLLIAGSYTPFTMLLLDGASSIIIATLVWVTAVVGITLNIINLEKYKKISLICYIAMGWIVVFALPQLLAKFAWEGFILLLLGGISYTVGVLFYKQKHLPVMHVVWHFFVLAGSILQFFGIYLYIYLK